VLVSLVEQIQVLRPQGRQEGIWIEELPHFSSRRGNAKLISKHLRSLRDEDFKYAVIGDPLHRPFLTRRHLHNRAGHGLTGKSPDHYAFTTGFCMRVHAKHRVR
jgi:hypothetical protein